MSKVSIIIPIYNSEATLQYTISSVLNQPFEDFELILIDDGSTDSSLDICEQYAAADTRVIVKSQKNRGVSSARNKGLEVATGNWIYFLDSDDYINHDFFEKVSPFLDDDIDIIQFGSIRKKHNNIESYRQTLKSREKLIISSFPEFIKTSNIGALCVWLHLIKRKVILQNKIYFSEDMSYNEDMLFMYQVLTNSNKYLFLGETIHTQLLVSNSLSRSPLNEKKVSDRLLLIDRVLKIIDDEPNYEESIIIEANKLLKGFFGSVASYMMEDPTSTTLTPQKLKTFNLKYKDLHKKYRKSFKGIIPMVANVNIIYVVKPLELKIKLNSKGSSLKQVIKKFKSRPK